MATEKKNAAAKTAAKTTKTAKAATAAKPVKTVKTAAKKAVKTEVKAVSQVKPFMDADFLLDTETAKTLYHDHAEKMPIIDYHCHLQPKEI